MGRIARRLAITGKVQGVCYRAWTIDTARKLGLAGWVRNRADGSVEAVVEGEEEAVTAFVTKAQRGPPAAQVNRVEVQPTAESGYVAFTMKPTI